MRRVFVQPFERAWQYRELIQVILWRELSVRFRNSFFSWGWAVAAPVSMLVVYTAVFSTTLKVSTESSNAGIGYYALSIFVGLIVFNLFSELLLRAPTLIHEHAPFVKRSIFPSEALAWIAMLRALVYAGIALVVLLVFEIAFTRALPWSVLLLPMLLIPLCLFLLGATWFLAALGAFTRDVSHLFIAIVPLFLFATPVFYSAIDVAEPVRWVLYLNPLTGFIEIARDILLRGAWPDPKIYLLSVLVAVFVFIGGYAFFTRYRDLAIDVI